LSTFYRFRPRISHPIYGKTSW